ncbi:hypothetical protein BpHYR1_030959 [Brachionus plicatilis]|uniref:Uncharacterized protein n=1 Tax=Brachionus plicatilis TaxID=10195 RepID=A0A3M7SW73_BRAPC|nr:hypothetical protein BpHYR1_030959 [Brachionus plicatilis]
MLTNFLNWQNGSYHGIETAWHSARILITRISQNNDQSDWNQHKIKNLASFNGWDSAETFLRTIFCDQKNLKRMMC